MSLKRSLAKQLLKMFFSGEDAECVLAALIGMRKPAWRPTRADLIKVAEALPHVEALVAVGIVPLRLPVPPDVPGVCIDFDGYARREPELLAAMRAIGEWRFIGKK